MDMFIIWDRLCKMFKGGVISIVEFWPVKLVVSAISTGYSFLFGGCEAIIAAAIVFVALDTITKWASITKRWLVDRGHVDAEITTSTMICGFLHAWEPGYLTSTDLRRHWGEKLFTYIIFIILASVINKLPEIMVFGVQVNKTIVGGIYSFILLTELFSISENFEEMGNQKMAQFRQFLITVTNKVTGGNFTFSYNTGGKKSDEV